MRADGVVRRFDDLGRIFIPKEIRMKLFGTKCTDGELMEIFIDGDSIILRKYEENKDDVCEWKYSGNVYISCNYKRFTDLHSFEYCPYCGKKIKVVE